MPSLLMSPSSVGLRPTRPAPRGTVGWGGGVAGAASLGGPVALLAPSSPASKTSSATRGDQPRRRADMWTSHPRGKTPPSGINGARDETFQRTEPPGGSARRSARAGEAAPLSRERSGHG